MVSSRPLREAFTLIELLIVVAIIGILAAIAVPNFLNAQLRAKVSRVMADFRNYGTSIESYILDNNAAPWDVPCPSGDHGWASCLSRLTTPVAYMSSVAPDVFQAKDVIENLSA
ncbi:MAG: type II secretion system protein [Candidatus Hinthialibacter sp.]